MTELKAYYADQIAAGNTVLGIELGSTRIKAVRFRASFRRSNRRSLRLSPRGSRQ